MSLKAYSTDFDISYEMGEFNYATDAVEDCFGEEAEVYRSEEGCIMFIPRDVVESSIEGWKTMDRSSVVMESSVTGDTFDAATCIEFFEHCLAHQKGSTIRLYWI